MGRPPGKNFPVPLMVKVTTSTKERLEALASRVPFDVSVGFSVVARRAIAIGLQVLERDPRMILEPPEGDAEAAREVLARPLMARVFDRAAELREQGDDATEAAVSAALEVLGGSQAPQERTEAPQVKPAKGKARKGPPRGDGEPQA